MYDISFYLMMKLQFSISPETDCHAEVKEPNFPTISWRENKQVHTFPKCISAMWNANSLVQELNSDFCIHFRQQ